jgi:hypothetical protein
LVDENANPVMLAGYAIRRFSVALILTACQRFKQHRLTDAKFLRASDSGKP